MSYGVSSRSQSSWGGFVRESFNRDYVERLKNGDATTERHFANYFGQLLRIKLRARLRSAQLIEDLSQETFLRVLTALRRKDGLEYPERLGAFVNTVCQNLLFELYRAESRRPAELPDHLDVPDERASAESALVTDERKDQVRQVLQDLTAKDRELLYMVFYEEIDKDEICRRFSVEREYLRVLVHRAKARFRKELLERHGEDFYSHTSHSGTSRCQRKGLRHGS
jgi:RNA polymerase sigma-70 factor (ECF subfamily)